MTVNYEMKGDAVALLTLNRPEALNAVDSAMRADLLDAVATASADKAVRAVVLTGAGRGFCAGADLKDIISGRNVEDVLNAEYSAFLTVIRTCEKPVIAVINGPAAGIGMTLALTCDLQVMSEEAYLMSAFANISLTPDGGLSWLLTQRLGYARAYEAAIEAQKLDAAFCLSHGLINRAVPPADLMDNALSWAQSLAERAPIANGLTKRAFRAAAHKGLGEALSFEAMLQRTAIESEDCREGVTAMLEKRKPVFKGK